MREAPEPSDLPPPGGQVEQGTNSGGANAAGGGGSGAGSQGGDGQGGALPPTSHPFASCACAAIAQQMSAPVECTDCVQLNTDDPSDGCFAADDACTIDGGCQAARAVIGACAGDVDCVAQNLGPLTEETAALVFAYYDCVCTACFVCTPAGQGEGGGKLQTSCEVDAL